MIPSFHRPVGDPDRHRRNGYQRLGRPQNRTTDARPGPTRPRGSSAPAPPTATMRRPSPTWFPTRQRPDHLRRGQRRRRRHRLGLARPGLSRPAATRRASSTSRCSRSWSSASTAGSRSTRPATWPATASGIPYASGHAATYTYGGGAATPRTWATRSARSTRPTRSRTLMTPNYGVRPPGGLQLPPGGEHSAVNTQVDNAGIDVRLTQLRNLLAGTRPAPEDQLRHRDQRRHELRLRGDGLGQRHRQSALHAQRRRRPAIDTALLEPTRTAIPSSCALTPRLPAGGARPARYPAESTTPTVASPPAINSYLNLVQVNLQQPGPGGLLLRHHRCDQHHVDTGSTSGLPRDAADDNYNAFDPFPAGHTTASSTTPTTTTRPGRLILPVDRMRRYVTPADINGTGSVTPWTSTARPPGADPLGRVQFNSYYRPPGSPGSIASSPTRRTATPPATVGTLGAIYYPSNATGNNLLLHATARTTTRHHARPTGLSDLPARRDQQPAARFEFFKLPPIVTPAARPRRTRPPAGFTFQFQQQSEPRAMPLRPALPTGYEHRAFPDRVPDLRLSGQLAAQHTDGLNDADEMNLYVPNPLVDSPFGPSDLEWLYRQQDVDGASLTSRLAQLAPVSFTNPIDGQRRRRLFALDSWEMNNFVWANDNPRQRASRPTASSPAATQPRVPSERELRPASRTGVPLAATGCPPRRWPIATRRSTSTTRCRSPTTPTSRSARSGSATPINCSSRCCRPRRSTRPKSWRSSASSWST